MTDQVTLDLGALERAIRRLHTYALASNANAQYTADIAALQSLRDRLAKAEPVGFAVKVEGKVDHEYFHATKEGARESARQFDNAVVVPVFLDPPSISEGAKAGPEDSGQCDFQYGTVECTGTGLLWDADTDGWNEDFNEGPCPKCNSAEYLQRAKEDAESSSFYSNAFDSGTGLNVWLGAVATCLLWNRPAAVKALKEIGKVECLVDLNDDHSLTAIVPVEFNEDSESVVVKEMPRLDEDSISPPPSISEAALREALQKAAGMELHHKNDVFMGSEVIAAIRALGTEVGP